MSLDVQVMNNTLLSKKEASVFKRLAKGMTYQAIALETSRSEETVKTQAKAIREKLHASSMVQAVSIAVANGILTVKQIGKSGLFSIFMALSLNFSYSNDKSMRNSELKQPQITRVRKV